MTSELSPVPCRQQQSDRTSIGENMISMPSRIKNKHRSSSHSALHSLDELELLLDVDGILDQVLLEARQITNANAGTIFLVEKNLLRFSYVQNDTLFKQDDTNKLQYTDYTLPIEPTSIVGYVALTGEPLMIEDAYTLPEGTPYFFLSNFDKKTGYRTVSIMTIPLKTYQDRLVGVLQLINAQDATGKCVPFSSEHAKALPLLAGKAATVIDRGLILREQNLRMVRLAEIHDPAETGAHAQRVGAYAAEIYKKYAWNKVLEGSPGQCRTAADAAVAKQILMTSGLIRLAAMLHDVGKVGISDTILKKPSRLSDEEFDVMRHHTVLGAGLFVNTASQLDTLSYEIALYHHTKWDGGGYSGPISKAFSTESSENELLRGEAIPISARVTAIADVYDALCSKRMYKVPWPEEEILTLIKEEAGHHFDPKVVEAFFQVYDIIQAIRKKYRDEPILK
jgi:hypothetical protein